MNVGRSLGVLTAEALVYAFVFGSNCDVGPGALGVGQKSKEYAGAFGWSA